MQRQYRALVGRGLAAAVLLPCRSTSSSFRLLDRKRIHVGPKEHRCPFTVAQHTHHARSTQVFMHLVTAIRETRCDLRGRHDLLMGELGMKSSPPSSFALSSSR